VGKVLGAVQLSEETEGVIEPVRRVVVRVGCLMVLREA
jgi:hypothetical protein